MMVNISSFGTRGYLHSVLYGMSKAGLDKMAADMAVDLRDTGVTALSLWPGLVKNEAMLARGLDNFQAFRSLMPRPPSSSDVLSSHWPVTRMCTNAVVPR